MFRALQKASVARIISVCEEGLVKGVGGQTAQNLLAIRRPELHPDCEGGVCEGLRQKGRGKEAVGGGVIRTDRQGPIMQEAGPRDMGLSRT